MRRFVDRTWNLKVTLPITFLKPWYGNLWEIYEPVLGNSLAKRSLPVNPDNVRSRQSSGGQESEQTGSSVVFETSGTPSQYRSTRMAGALDISQRVSWLVWLLPAGQIGLVVTLILGLIISVLFEIGRWELPHMTTNYIWLRISEHYETYLSFSSSSVIQGQVYVWMGESRGLNVRSSDNCVTVCSWSVDVFVECECVNSELVFLWPWLTLTTSSFQRRIFKQRVQSPLLLSHRTETC